MSDKDIGAPFIGIDPGLKKSEATAFICAKCRQEMRYNVPRLGSAAGFVHALTGDFLCAGLTNAASRLKDNTEEGKK